jgi:uncharacterized membrane protein
MDNVKHEKMKAKMHRSILLAIAAVAIPLCAGAASAAAEHQELKATPGLWKITYRVRVSGQPDPVILKWRCVSEEQMDDPASAFARPLADQGTCQRSGYTQNSASMSWKYHCSSQDTILDSRGAIKFDTPLHYTGQVKISGMAMGFPIANVIAIEGDHRAACTSPED